MTMISVTDLVHNFADACRALVPMLERAEVPWRDDTKYDNWDRISGPLFASFVTEPCGYHVGDFGNLHIAGYDFHGRSPTWTAYVAVVGPEPRRFIGLSSVNAPFDRVLAESVDGDAAIPLEGAQFVFVVERPSGKQIVEVVDLAAE